MDANISNQLNGLVDKTIFYQGQNLKILKWKLVGGNYCIVTDARTLQFYPSEIQLNFLEKYEEEKSEEVIRKDAPPSKVSTEKPKVAVVIPAENETIKETLLDIMKKVKEDPAFLAQAKVICEITNTMVNVQKTEIDMVKLQNSI